MSMPVSETRNFSSGAPLPPSSTPPLPLPSPSLYRILFVPCMVLLSLYSNSVMLPKPSDLYDDSGLDDPYYSNSNSNSNKNTAKASSSSSSSSSSSVQLHAVHTSVTGPAYKVADTNTNKNASSSTLPSSSSTTTTTTSSTEEADPPPPNATSSLSPRYASSGSAIRAVHTSVPGPVSKVVNTKKNTNASASSSSTTTTTTSNSTEEADPPPPNATSSSLLQLRPYTPYTFIDDDLVAWRTNRTNVEIYNSWFENGKGDGDLHSHNADVQGPILDFAIAGFPKCGTTAMMRNLAPITTMPPDQDICTPVQSTVYYAYRNWPNEFGQRSTNSTEPKLLKGSKCPRFIETSDLTDFGAKLPKTRLIVGIRHPVKWFQSFFNMQMFIFKGAHQDIDESLQRAKLQQCDPKVRGRKKRSTSCDSFGCPGTLLVCAARSRFHLSLARMGKTARDKEEQDLLVSEILQSKKRMNDNSTTLFPIQLEEKKIPNHVFLYESSQPQEEYFWQSLSEFVRVNRTDLPEDQGYRMGNGLNTDDAKQLEQQKKNLFDICDPKYDYFRQELMPIAYTMQKWLRTYFIPASKVRDDVVIPNVDKFEEIVETFARDPCNRLIRNDTDGEYYVSVE